MSEEILKTQVSDVLFPEQPACLYQVRKAVIGVGLLNQMRQIVKKRLTPLIHRPPLKPSRQNRNHRVPVLLRGVYPD